MACLKGVEKVIRCMYKNNPTNVMWQIELYTDSVYTINCATKWAAKWILYNWKRPVSSKLKDICNLDLIKKLYKLCSMYPVNFHHVRGHQKEPNCKGEGWELWNGNRTADKLAGEGTVKAKNRLGRG